MSHDKASDYWTHRYMIKILLHVTGLWPNEHPSVFYRLLPIPFIFVNSCVILGTIFHIKMHLTNIASLTKGLNTMTSFLTIILKMTCVMVNRGDAYELHNLLDHHFSELINDREISTTTLTNFRSFRRLSWAFTFFVGVVVFLIAVSPVISIAYQYLSSADPIIYPHVYPTVYPWFVDPPGLRYKIHFIIELMATVPHFSVSPSIDSLFMLYGFQMTSQFREMSHRLMKIDKITDDRRVIHECVLQHQSIMRCRDIIQKIFGPIVLWLMTANAISLCTIIFQLSQMKSMTLSTIIQFIAYVMVKVIQTFMYAYTGTFLTSEVTSKDEGIVAQWINLFDFSLQQSESYQQSIYNSNWHSNKRFMTSIIIMLSQKPIILTACNFSIVSLDIFVKVLNTAISYFFLLQTLS